tara:strand:- start:238 stop:1527 length:1290 start_codon:yes stop_codon:yes gene_type:complete
MKWIGQHIWGLISRFRSDVYLEDVSTGTIESGGNLGLDSDNKIVKATVSSGGDFTLTGDSGSDQTISTGNTLDIAGGNAISTVVGATDTVTVNHDDTSSQASVDNSGRAFIQDITLDTYGHVTGITSATDADTYSGTMTSFIAQTDSGSGARYSTSTAASISILGATGVGVTNSAGVITATAVPSEIDHDSLSNFVAAEHVDWAGASAGTVHSTNIPTLNQDTTGGAATATNLVASTSTAVQLGTIELGHADDTTIARSASGVATIEGKTIVTRDKVIYIETSNFSDDINTDAHYIPFVTTSEHQNFGNVAVPFVAPAPGKLLGVHYKANNHTNTTSNTVTFRLDRLDDGLLWAGGNEATIGTKVVDGVVRTTWCSADFTDLSTAGASGTNAFDAGEMIGVSLQNSVNFTSTKYSATLVFEFDFSSYYS